MRIHNLHERLLAGSVEKVGALVDGLAGPNDRLWPSDRWPAMRFDGPLRPGARGGHGPVGYAVAEYVPGQHAAFTFDGRGLIAGIEGGHRFEVLEAKGRPVLRHVIEARCGLAAWLRWILVIEPLHDALIEDALDRAERCLSGRVEHPARWSPRVRFLRWLVASRR
jgi:hypothetical protein